MTKKQDTELETSNSTKIEQIADENLPFEIELLKQAYKDSRRDLDGDELKDKNGRRANWYQLYLFRNNAILSGYKHIKALVQETNRFEEGRYKGNIDHKKSDKEFDKIKDILSEQRAEYERHKKELFAKRKKSTDE